MKEKYQNKPFTKIQMERFLIYMFNKIPKRYIKSLLKILITKNFDFYVLCNKMIFHEKWPLYIARFNETSIIETIDRAKIRFPTAEFYVLSDIGRSDLPINLGQLRLRYINDLNVVKKSQTQKVFICLFENDEDLLKNLRQIKNVDNASYFTPRSFIPTSRYFHRNKIAKKVLKSEVENKIFGTFDLADLDNLIQTIDLTRNIEGDYVEIGVYRGRSAHLVLNYMKYADIGKKCYFLDFFEGFTYKEAINSQDATWKDRFGGITFSRVKHYLSNFDNAKTLKLNIISDSLPEEIIKVAVCNIDVNLYEATLAALQKISPLIVKGGILVVEDQGHTPLNAGAYLAMKYFLNSNIGQNFLPIHMASGQAFLINMQ